MKATTYTNKGEKGKEINLPKQFSEEIRTDLIKRAVLAIQANKRQPYGGFLRAGMDYSATLSRRRRDYRGSYGKGMSRIPRKVMVRRGTQFIYTGAFISGTVGGRRAHPPKAEKVWKQKINKTERRKAIRSAIAATLDKELIKNRGHEFENVPIIIEKLENIQKTKDLKQLMIKLGLEKEMERASKKRIRAGKGKIRGRKYKTATGPLLVIEKNSPILKAAANLPGFEVCNVDSLNTELLAPGTFPGRLTIWSAASIEKLDKDNLYYKKNGSVQDNKKPTSN
ncbi:50S ribosomal protein L4 [Candidatus Woesearchaeota archaeon]|jgi:large subunit ribosomal protein L4e|nr:50S ribosomal protein L4 [Candidatus Woesearchaeota archaeon]MBT4321739.1 50S ribosomal protein L4 [Candidatus Woesearchaeota archaeon]MBT4631169.1 50S ribosomal protein L4 [Candidatus Woesearchaeota archaeon]